VLWRLVPVSGVVETSAHCDVVVVGSGVAGLAAAIEAATRGLSVVLLESAAEAGGASAISVGGSCLVGTPLQARNGIQDDVELALSDWRRTGGEAADLDWARRYLTDSSTEVFGWCETMGLTWSELRLHEGNAVARWHLPAGGGAAVVDRLLARCRSLGVTVRTSAPVTQLRCERGQVLGVSVAGPGGPAHYRAAATVVCAGGFTSNRDLLQVHAPRLAGLGRFLCGGSATATGEGYGLLRRAGASFRGLEHLWLYPVGTPDPEDPSGARGLVVRGIRNEIWVNGDGLRFHDEDLRGGLTGTPAVIAQRGQTAWGIFDSREAGSMLLLNNPYFGSATVTSQRGQEDFWQRSRHAWRSDSIAGLAAAAGLPADAVAGSLSRHNAIVREGAVREPGFGRHTAGLRPIEGPAYCAIQYFPLVQKNLGGVRTDASCRVQSAAGKSLGGLYAAGEVAGMAGGCINGAGALEGTMFGPSLYAGRIAGRSAARDLMSPG
jgi:predicted oxidoreductase